MPLEVSGGTLRQPLLKRGGPQRGGGAASGVASGMSAATATLCVAHVVLGMSAPILLDWVKWQHGGNFRFSTAALTFRGYAIAATLGLAWTACCAEDGLRTLARLDMLLRFCVIASFFTFGDILSFASMRHLDVGTYSLLGKSLNIVLTALMSRLLLSRHHTPLQYALIGGVALTTLAFCHAEGRANACQPQTLAAHGEAAACEGRRRGDWAMGILQRAGAVGMNSFAAVLQEKIFRQDPTVPFMVQQCWMATGACATSLISLHFMYGAAIPELTRGFDDWRVWVLLAMYVVNGLATGLMVKWLGALPKALCSPLYLGGCYAYAVLSGSATISVGAVASWMSSTAMILAYAVVSVVGVIPKGTKGEQRV